jgi:predicted XRE-type DNA-binding protein
MATAKSESGRLLAAVENLNTRLEDLFILEASRAGIKQQEIRSLLGIDMARVSRIAKHVKQGK